MEAKTISRQISQTTNEEFGQCTSLHWEPQVKAGWAWWRWSTARTKEHLKRNEIVAEKWYTEDQCSHQVGGGKLGHSQAYSKDLGSGKR